MEFNLPASLATKRQSPGQTSEAGRKRLHNIQWITKLPQEGLLFQKDVRQVLIHTTESGEELYIQYPGKESARPDEKKRPYDFFPIIKTGNGYADDYSFWDIWRLLFDQLEPRKQSLQEEMRVLAAVFYRMAFMVDHELLESPAFDVREINFKEDGGQQVLSRKREPFAGVYAYRPPKEICDYLSRKIDCGKISFEAFLHYNNLLAWNEDSKYYYRAVQKGKAWMGAIGRVNNLLTHISVLGYLLSELKTFDVFYKFSTGAGVAPAGTEEIQRITGGLVYR